MWTSTIRPDEKNRDEVLRPEEWSFGLYSDTAQETQNCLLRIASRFGILSKCSRCSHSCIVTSVVPIESWCH
ncbi:hypothetical protein TNCV_4397411 [Trichonephila clavipes]|nr:hypothetical protein TNCV_4397411 [Trichonephila clavipes]